MTVDDKHSSGSSPTHPDILKVVYNPGFHESWAESLVSLPAGAVFTKITGVRQEKVATWATVQTGRSSHIDLQSDLVYCNHSCDPSLEFDMQRMEIRVARVRKGGIKPGDHLTFFYPSTELEMTQPFECRCGSERCKGRIEGAGRMKAEKLKEYWLNGHIESLLAEKRAEGRGWSCRIL